MRRLFVFAAAIFAVVLLAGASARAATVTLVYDQNAEPCVIHGVAFLQDAIRKAGLDVTVGDSIDAGAAGTVIRLGVLDRSPDITSIIQATTIKIPEQAESFVLAAKSPVIYAGGTDAVGTMYAAYDLAERFAMADDPAALPSSIQAQAHVPSMEIRAVNPFFHVDAFNDPKSWYFDEKYWETYLDELSYDRYNLLDIHAMYELVSTFFPNCYLYMMKSDRFPSVGIDAAQAKKNLEMFKTIVKMAKDRGIRTSLMSYHASWALTSEEEKDGPSDEDLAAYTSEIVTKMINQVPDLWMIGFRIGESGRPEEFFQNSYIKGVKDADRDINLFTRSWLANPFHVRGIADAFPGRFYIELKYNGEQLGLPYHAMTSNRKGAAPSYTWEDYTNWPRHYKILWQIRSNGTHRLFRWGDPVFAARTMRTVQFGHGAGFSMEPMTSYYPVTDFFHKDPKQFDYFTWDHQRNWFWYMVWGRMAFEPDTPESVWINRFAAHFGKAGARDVYDTVVSMSRIVPLIYAYRCMGPDHRNMAPEFETGGSLNDFANNTPLDFYNMRAIDEYVRWTLFDGALRDAKIGPYEVASLLDQYAAQANDAAQHARDNVDPAQTSEFKDLLIELDALTNLAHYYSNKIRGATHFAFFLQTHDLSELAQARAFTTKAHEAWDRLSTVGEANYGQIPDTLRMKRFVNNKPTFTWRELQPSLQKDIEELDNALAQVLSEDSKPAIYHTPVFNALQGQPLNLRATLINLDAVPTLLYRTAGSEAEWIELPMAPAGIENVFGAEIPANAAQGKNEYFIAAKNGDDKARYPSGRARKRAAGQFDIEDYLYNDAKNITNELKRIENKEKEKYVTLTFAPETGKPVIAIRNVEVLDKGEKARFTVSAEDASGIEEMRIYFKALPTREAWQDKEMTPAGDNLFTIDLPLDSQGLMYYFKAADKYHNAAAYPWLLDETPYRWIDAWDKDKNPYVN